MITHRFATADDVRSYYGEQPKRSLRAIVILLDGEPAALVGLEIHGDRFIAFSEFKDELRPHLRTMPVLRAVKAAQAMIREAPLPVLAMNITQSPMLERLGFVELQPGVHLWPS